MRGAGFLAIWSDIAPNNLTDYRHRASTLPNA
jgi:hypothetical protein